MDRAAASAHPDAEEVTVKLAVSADGRVTPTPRRASGGTPYVNIKMTLTRVDPLEPLRKLLPGGWTLATPAKAKGRDTCLL